MNSSRLLLYKAIVDLDESYIDEALAAAPRKLRRVIYGLAAAAACLCLAALSAAALNKRHVTAAELTGSAGLNVRIYQDGAGGAEVGLYSICREGEAENESLTIRREDGSGDLAAYIASESGGVDRDEMAGLESLAFREPDPAQPELTDEILSARERLIYSRSWAADGYTVYIEDLESGRIERLPSFSELFPGWDMPAADSPEDSITGDGLGADLLYGMTVKVVEASGSSVICAPLCDVNLFAAGQLVEVIFDSPEQGGASLQPGDTVFVSYYGRDCDLKNAVITAASISEAEPG